MCRTTSNCQSFRIPLSRIQHRVSLSAPQQQFFIHISERPLPTGRGQSTKIFDFVPRGAPARPRPRGPVQMRTSVRRRRLRCAMEA